MTFQADLYAHIVADAGVSPLIGTRLYPSSAPQDVTTPFVIYYEFATPRDQTFNGIAVHRPRIQWSIYADHYDDCLDISGALQTALLAFESPVIFEDERAYHDVTTGLYRRDLDTRLPHV